jgi:arsenate reductase
MSNKTIIFHNPSCSKSRETLALLKNSNCELEVVEYLKNTPNVKELKKIIQLLNIKPLDLIRKNENIFKENFEGKVLSDDEWINIMVLHPKLIERPIVVSGKKAIIGRPPVLVLDIIS